MHTHRRAAAAFLIALASVAGAMRAHADDCIDFHWDVSRERALFAGQPVILASGKDVKSAPTLVPNRLYRLGLAAEEEVAFSVTPGKRTPAPATFAGLATLRIPVPGVYRIAIDLPAWVDVVSGAALVPAKDFEGQHSCAAPHKIVEFDLTGSRSFVLQFSSASSANILISVTASPPRKL